MNEIILKLKDKDDKAAYEYSKILRAESAESDKEGVNSFVSMKAESF